ncbi:MAG: alpha-2-macroglobulin family protein, partial [Hyphomonadaceae bacterium]
VRFDKPEGGAVIIDYDLDRGAARGTWRAALDIDGMGRAGSVSWSVEDFVPQRIKVGLEADDETAIGRNEIRDLTVDARFLYGAPGAGLTVKSQARLEADPSPFEAFEGFRFGIDGETFREEIIEFTDQTADGAGIAVIPLDPGRRGRSAQRPLRLNTVVSVLEPGGRAVSNSVRVPYRPRDLYIGTKTGFDGRAARDKPATFELAAISADGEARAAQLNWKILEIDWHYDWYRDGSRWRWRRSRNVRTINEGVTNTQAGSTAEISIDGLDWGDHELIVTGPDGAESRRKFWVGWGGYVSDDGVEAPDRVSVTGPMEAPRAGRNAQITISAPYDGEAQIVVATDRILSVQTHSVSSDGTQVSLPVTDEWGEGAYVMVTVYTPRDPVLQARPRRAVGVAYVPTDVSKRTFELTINAPDVVRPRREQLITIDIGDGPREPVFLTLAAVDEGILQLTKFSSPDPVDYFFGKKALGVSLYDDYGRLLDPNLGLPAEVRTGGDQLGGEGLSVVPTKTVALFSGLVDVGRNGKAQVRLDLPDFNGELRLMAVAWSETGLGAASQPMIVRDEVPAELILPRFLAPGDEALVTASIDNVELETGQFDAVLTADGPVSVAVGNVSRTLAKGQRADEPMRISTNENGISRLRFNVDGPANYVVDHQYLIETRSPYLPVTETSRALMQPGETFEVASSLLDGFVPGSSEVTVSFSSLPMDPGALYASLARYPYGCTEQTTSRALPLLYSEQLVAMGAEGDRGEGAKTHVQEAVNRILNRQSADGAFGLWREGDRYATPWLGAYATDFLLRAKEQGYTVPQEALDRSYQAMRNIAQGDAWRVYGYNTDAYESRWHDDTQKLLMQRSSAFALYVLAKAGKADVSRLRYLHDRQLDSIQSPLAKAHIAAGLA